MAKFYHEYTAAEMKANIEAGVAAGETWAQFAEKYPQPKWCDYPDAVMGMMGCWSLIDNLVTGEDYCKNCDCYKPKLEEGE